jgi:hypothetical protein
MLGMFGIGNANGSSENESVGRPGSGIGMLSCNDGIDGRFGMGSTNGMSEKESVGRPGSGIGIDRFSDGMEGIAGIGSGNGGRTRVGKLQALMARRL